MTDVEYLGEQFWSILKAIHSQGLSVFFGRMPHPGSRVSPPFLALLFLLSFYTQTTAMAVNRLWVRLRAITLTLLRGLGHGMQSLLGEDPNMQLAHQGDRLSPPASPPLAHAQHVIRQTSNPCTNVKVC